MIPHLPRSKFRIGSLTKPFTAALVLGLVDEGRVDLDAPAGRYVEELASTELTAVTVRHLLTHASGIPDVVERPDVADIVRRRIAPGDFVSRYCVGSPRFTPGTDFAYSNCGYLILGLLFERVSGKGYAEGVTQLAERVGLKETGYAGPEEIVPRMARVGPSAASGTPTDSSGGSSTRWLSRPEGLRSLSNDQSIDDLGHRAADQRCYRLGGRPGAVRPRSSTATGARLRGARRHR